MYAAYSLWGCCLGSDLEKVMPEPSYWIVIAHLCIPYRSPHIDTEHHPGRVCTLNHPPRRISSFRYLSPRRPDELLCVCVSRPSCGMQRAKHAMPPRCFACLPSYSRINTWNTAYTPQSRSSGLRIASAQSSNANACPFASRVGGLIWNVLDERIAHA